MMKENVARMTVGSVLQHLVLIAGCLILVLLSPASAAQDLAQEQAVDNAPGAAAAAGPTPFLRDMDIGYLMNCSFLSPKPYSWPHEEFLLSGWEVDRSGGHIAFQPDCNYPEGFGFHSDWFKLVDTRDDASVSLKRQIARQASGSVTLEFRFKLPARMDDVRFELSDLAQPGLAFVTENGSLCVEDSQGRRAPLVALEDMREYGVKAIADLNAQQATVFVDGTIKAAAIPFTKPVSTFDSFSVQTGKSGIGELFLNPVNIHKGYTVNETFVACGVGAAPADWESVSTTVRMMECCSKPDVYSLELFSNETTRADMRKTFAPLSQKTVLEFRWMVMQIQDASMAELLCQTSGVRIATRGEDICLTDGDSLVLPIVQKYRTQFWYSFKIIADPLSGTVEVFVNGKPVIAQDSFCPGLGCFDSVHFSTYFSSLMYIDDVFVYPWRDYPEDYVPEPKPMAANNGLLLGVQSCNLWREGVAYAGWDYVLPFRDQRMPYLGWYDEGHPEEADWEIKWQVEHGIAFEQYCWYRPNNAIHNPIKNGVLDHGIIQGLFNARYSRHKRFTIMYTNQGAGETDPEDWREHIIPYWIEYFFKDPRYLKVGGKPVLSIYHLEHFLRMFDGVEGARQAILTLRNAVVEAGFPGIIVLMEERGADSAVLGTMKSLGVDYAYAYTWLTPDAQVQRDKNIAQRDAAAAVGLRNLTSLSMGWDREAWGVHDGGFLPPPAFESLAAWARDAFMPGFPEDSLGRRMAMLANWNEFGEGHFLMPSTLAGFGYLDALRKVFTDGGDHEDAIPTDSQKRRFTVLYPKD